MTQGDIDVYDIYTVTLRVPANGEAPRTEPYLCIQTSNVCVHNLHGTSCIVPGTSIVYTGKPPPAHAAVQKLCCKNPQ